MKLRVRYSDILIKVIEIYTIFTMIPMVSVILPQTIRYVIILGIIGLTFLYIVYESRVDAISFFVLIAIILFLIVIYFGKTKGQESFISYFATGMFFWIPLIFMTLLRECDEQQILKLKRTYLISVIITVSTTLIGNVIFPEVSRELAGAASSTEAVYYSMYNIGGYGFVYGCLIALPIIFYGFFYSKSIFLKYLYLAIIILMYTLFVFTQYSTAIVLSVAVLLMMFLFKSKNPACVFLIMLICSIVFWMSRSLISNLFKTLSSMFMNNGMNQISDRMNAIASLLVGINTTGSAAVRGNLYQQSWDLFIQNPLFGALLSSDKVGGHSELLDIMGASGLVGIILFVILMRTYFIRIKKFFMDYSQLKYVLITAIIFILLLCIDTAFTSPNIGFAFFMSPILFLERDVVGAYVE